MPPAIALDATYSLGRNLTGVGVYCREIIRGLATEHPTQRFRLCYRSQRLLASLRERLPPNCSRRLLTDSFAPSAKLFHGLNQRIPNRRFARACVTVHDLFVLTGEYSTAEFRHRFAQQVRHAVDRSDVIICVSRFTADSVCDLLNVEQSRVRVIHHGVSLEPVADGDQALAREPWILHTGALQHRKNLMRLIGAFEKGVAPHWRLVLAGGDGYGATAIHARIATSPARHRIQALGFIDDAALRTLYRRASVFAFPSLDEGFGMPVLDAMANGVPVISSNRSSLREVCGDAAMLVDPLDEEDLAHSLHRLTESPELQMRYAKLGRLRATQFAWPRAVAETWKVYLELLGSPTLET